MSDKTSMMAPETKSEGAASAPDSVQATANALYGESGKADGGQAQQAAESAPAGNPTGDKKDGEQAAGDKPAQPDGAPEKYEFKPVDGRQLDSEIVDTFSEVAKELNLTQEAAQKMLDRMAPKMEQRQQAQIESIRAGWREETRNNKEYGGDKLPESLTVAKKALDQFGSPSLRALLNESGLGDHPDVVGLFYKIGRAISEDGYVGPSVGAGRQTPKDFASAAAALYSNQP